MLKRQNNKQLKKYKKFLADFERDYVFSVVTDIPQFKIVYERMVKSFNFDNLYTDIYEPVIELNNRQKIRQVNIITIFECVLSILGLISIIVDGKQIVYMFSFDSSVLWIIFDFIENWLRENIFVFIVILVLLLSYLIKRMNDKK